MILTHSRLIFARYLGKSYRLAVKKHVLCSECQGRGRKQSSAASECRGCRGTGQRVTLRQLGPNLVQQLQMHCPDCNGTGEHILPTDRCVKCNGQQVLVERKVLTVNIEKVGCSACQFSRRFKICSGNGAQTTNHLHR